VTISAPCRKHPSFSMQWITFLPSPPARFRREPLAIPRTIQIQFYVTQNDANSHSKLVIPPRDRDARIAHRANMESHQTHHSHSPLTGHCGCRLHGVHVRSRFESHRLRQGSGLWPLARVVFELQLRRGVCTPLVAVIRRAFASDRYPVVNSDEIFVVDWIRVTGIANANTLCTD
jgi:hypothetical protein